MHKSVKLSASEKFAWEYIQNNLDDIPLLSITKLSEEACVSTASIVRVLKKQGFTGYTEFRQKMIEKSRNTASLQVFEKIDTDIKKAILKNEYEVMNTLKLLNTLTIEDGVQQIKNAKKVYLFARGFSEFVGREMQIKLELADKNCELHTDPNIIRVISSKISRDNIVIFISLNGETPELIESAATIHKNGTPILLITTNEESTLFHYSDISFVGFKAKNSFFPDYEVRSRLPLQIIGRILLDAYVIRQQNL